MTISGTAYVFDPTFKSYSITAAGVNLSTATGFNQASFISSAEQGSTIATDYVQDLNSSNIASALSTETMSLVNYLKTNLPTATVDDTLGGKTILPVSIPVRQTTLSYLNPGSTPTEYTTDIPSTFNSTLQIQYGGINETLDSDDIYGRRLTIFFNVSNQPVLYLDGVVKATGTAQTPGTYNPITFTVTHNGSFAGSFVTTQSLLTGKSSLIANNWGSAGRGSIDYHKRILAQNNFNGGDPASEARLGETMAVTWATYATEFSQISNLLDRLNTCTTSIAHLVGLVSYGQGPSFDLGGLVFNTISRVSDRSKETPMHHQMAVYSSMLENSVLQQIFDVGAVSTVGLLSIANSASMKIFAAVPSNWSTVRPQLGSYSQSTLDLIENSFMTSGSGWTIYLPESASITSGSWTGFAYLGLNDDGRFTAIIGGGLKGGETNGVVPPDGGDSSGEQKPPTPPPTDTSDEPIDLFTGDYLHYTNDLKLGSAAEFPYALPFQRAYRSSRRLTSGTLGLGWIHSYQMTARADTDGMRGLAEKSPIEGSSAINTLFVTANLLNALPFAKDKVLISVLCSKWLSDQLAGNSVDVSLPNGGESFIKLPDGTYTAPFNTASTLVLNGGGTFTYKMAQGEAFNFNSLGNIASIVFPAGVTVTFTYDGNNRLSTVSNALGRTLTLTYTAGGKLQTVTDGTGRAISFVVDGSDNLTTFTDTLSRSITFEYSQPGLLTKVFKPENPTTPVVQNAYDSLYRVLTQKNALDQTFTYYFAGSRTEEVDPLGFSRILYFNQYGRTVIDVDRSGQKRTKEYDGLNRLVKTVEPELNSMEFVYDSKNNVLTKTSKPKPGSLLADIIQTFTYDSAWNKVKTSVDPLSQTTTFNYDATTGNLLSILRPTVGGQTPTVTMTYNSRGQILTRTDETGIVTKFSYDSVKEDLLSKIEDFGTGRLNLTSSFAYNSRGDRTSFTDERSNTAQFEYDTERRLTKRIEPTPFSFETTWEYDLNGRMTAKKRQTGDVANPLQIFTYSYTLTDKPLTVTEPTSLTTSFEYDQRDLLKKKTDPESRVWEFAYDALGRISTSKDPALQTELTQTYTANGVLQSVKDARNNVTSYSQDGFDRPDRTTFPDSTYEQQTYDANSNVLTFRTRAGQIITSTFDALNRRSTKAPASMPTQTMTYDLAGRTTKISTPVVSGDPTSGDFEFFFDTAGRLYQQKKPDAKTVTYVLDAVGNRTRLTYPDGYFVDYVFDAVNRVTDIKLNGSASAAAHFDYNSLSNRTKCSFANGCSVDYTYELDEDMNSVKHNFVGSAVTFGYSFNKVHDPINQLVSDFQFMWNPLADLVTTYAAANNLNQYPTVGGATLSYNGNGCLTGDGTWTYGFDTLNRLTTASMSGVSAAFLYDPLNRQGEKSVGSTKTRFVYDGWQRIADYDGSGTLLNRFVYGTGLDDLLLQVSNGGTVTYFHKDRQMSMIASTSTAGAVLTRNGYGPFGETASLTGLPSGYTGQRYDTETGLYFYKMRYYSPKLGRFLQPDPIGYTDGLNLYAYVKNRPLSVEDPLGLAGPPPDWHPPMAYPPPITSYDPSLTNYGNGPNPYSVHNDPGLTNYGRGYTDSNGNSVAHAPTYAPWDPNSGSGVFSPDQVPYTGFDLDGKGRLIDPSHEQNHSNQTPLPGPQQGPAYDPFSGGGDLARPSGDGKF